MTKQNLITKENDQPKKVIKQENTTTPQSEINTQTNIIVETTKIDNQPNRFYSPLVKYCT